MSKKERLQLWVQVLCSLAILFMLFRFVDIGRIRGLIGRITPVRLTVLVLLPIPTMFIRMYRWKLLYDGDGYGISIYDTFRLWSVGKALNIVLPATSGDVLKGYFGYRWTGVKERMLTVSLLDKIIALVSVILLGVPFALFYGYYTFAGIALAAAVPLAGLYALPRLRGSSPVLAKLAAAGTKRFRKWFDLPAAVKQARVNRSVLAWAFILSVAGWALTYVQLYVCFLAVGSPVRLQYVFSVAPLLTLIRLFPLTLNGLGSDEATIVMLFARQGAAVTQSGALAAGLLYRFLLLIIPGILGAYYLFTVRKITTDKPAGPSGSGSSGEHAGPGPGNKGGSF